MPVTTPMINTTITITIKGNDTVHSNTDSVTGCVFCKIMMRKNSKMSTTKINFTLMELTPRDVSYFPRVLNNSYFIFINF